MISLYDYILEALQINEANLKDSDNEWNKHDKIYSNQVIDILCKKHPSLDKLAIGNPDGKSAKYFFDPTVVSDDDIKKLKELKNEEDDAKELVKRFNNIMKKYNIKWNNIWKSPFTGYDGKVSKNKGNAFEQDYKENFDEKYKKELFNTCFNGKSFDIFSLDIEGGNNTKRPLQIHNGNLYVFPLKHDITSGKNFFNIGKYVTDITINKQQSPIYLSLKYGNKVTFINAGVDNDNCFGKKFFDDNKPTNDTPTIGDKIIEIFGIDKEKFKNVFRNYIKREKRVVNGEKDIVDVKNIINQDLFFKLLKSFIGFGYILVHKFDNGKVMYHDLRNEKI